MKPGQASLRTRIIAATTVAVAVTSLVFGFALFLFAYSMEDHLFQTILEEEVALQRAAWMAQGRLLPPRFAFVSIHRDEAGLPDDLRDQMAATPEQVEFYGREGRHYHIERFLLPPHPDEAGGGQPGEPAVAVAEVSRYLAVRGYRDATIQALLVIGTLLAALMAGIGAALAVRATAPLSRLAREIETAPDGIPQIDPDAYPQAEIGLLARSLAAAFTRIRAFMAREVAFTRDASHELRTPIAVISGAVEVIRLHDPLPPKVTDALGRIERTSRDMTQTLDLLLALAREDRAVLRAVVALRPLVDQAVQDARTRYPGRELDVTVSIPPGTTVLVEPAALRLILANLIGNSFHHAAGSTLRIEGDDRSIHLVDHGPGIADIDHALTPFVKGGASSGSGLGLAIVARLCEAACIGLSWRDTPGTGGLSIRLTLPADQTTL